jgi:hypothetical protein
MCAAMVEHKYFIVICCSLKLYMSGVLLIFTELMLTAVEYRMPTAAAGCCGGQYKPAMLIQAMHAQ